MIIREEPYGLYSIEISIMVIGMSGNIACCILMSRSRLMPDRNVNMNAVFSLVQSALDFFLCLFYILSLMDYPKIHNDFLGIFVCRIIKSKALFWMICSLRAAINIVIGIFNFIKLLYPFLKSVSNLIMFLTAGLGMLVTVSLLQIIPNIGMVSFIRNDKMRNCNFSAIHRFVEFTKLFGILRLYAVFNFIYLYLFPITVTLFVYKQIYDCLKDSEDTSRKIVMKEIMKSFLLDTVFYFFCFSFHSIIMFLSEFNDNFEYSITDKSYRIGMAMIVMYAVVYPYISMITRRPYKKPMSDIAKLLGVKSPAIILDKRSTSKYANYETASSIFNALFQKTTKFSATLSKGSSTAKRWSDDASF
uniref:GCR127 n=1 Tax=Schmidtea mediterranea TaxID=79327 RepID=A0A193KUT4_SCHMD|nr:GCR127 [Schmidtea mediterranea]